MKPVAYHVKTEQVSELIQRLSAHDTVVHAAITLWLRGDRDTRSYAEVLESIVLLLSDQCDEQRKQMVRLLSQATAPIGITTPPPSPGE